MALERVRDNTSWRESEGRARGGRRREKLRLAATGDASPATDGRHARPPFFLTDGRPHPYGRSQPSVATAPHPSRLPPPARRAHGRYGKCGSNWPAPLQSPEDTGAADDDRREIGTERKRCRVAQGQMRRA